MSNDEPSVDPVVNVGRTALKIVEKVGLAVIAVATVIAMAQEVAAMFANQRVHLADLLMMFIYLEVLAMTAVYLKSGQLPVRLPLYIAIVTLARYIVLDVKDMTNIDLLAIAAAILVVALAVLVIRYGHVKYPYSGVALDDKDNDNGGDPRAENRGGESYPERN